MSRLGSHVVYRVPEAHHAVTTKKHVGEAERTLEGSTYHAELREFAGLVTREHAPKGGGRKANPTYDLVIFPPGKNPVHVEGVGEGNGAGEAEIRGG